YYPYQLCHPPQSPHSHHSILFFFLMLPPPPTSTLFPYTTLFRSLPELPQYTDEVAAHGAADAAVVHLDDLLASFAQEDFVVHTRSEEHTSELQSLRHLVCRLLLEKKKKKKKEKTKTKNNEKLESK